MLWLVKCLTHSQARHDPACSGWYDHRLDLTSGPDLRGVSSNPPQWAPHKAHGTDLKRKREVGGEEEKGRKEERKKREKKGKEEKKKRKLLS